MTLSLAFLQSSNLENVPEEFDGVLDCMSLAICCSFNRQGSLLAVGCNDGRVVIWDFLTRGIAKSIQGHVHPVCSVSWSRNGRRLVSAATDNTIAVWDVMSSNCSMRWKFPSPILKVQFNPRNDDLLLVCPLKHAAILLQVIYDKETSKHIVLPTDPDDADPNVIASFDRRGQYIYTGNARGRIVILKCPKIIDEATKVDIISSFKIQTTSSTPAAIREIEFAARSKTYFLVNSSDRTIRLFRCEDAIKSGINGTCEEVRKFQDLVNKTMWRRCCFSGEAAHVCGGSARQHALYIWETETGTIKKMLQGTKGELLLDIQWHPLRPIMASISSGYVSIWAKAQIENWSAFAPDFKELEENMEYEERESEFDLEDEDNKPNLNDPNNDDENEDVDVIALKSERELVSSDEEEEDPNALIFLPVVIEGIEQDSDCTSNDVPLCAVPEESPMDLDASVTEIHLENAPKDGKLSLSGQHRFISQICSNLIILFLPILQRLIHFILNHQRNYEAPQKKPTQGK